VVRLELLPVVPSPSSGRTTFTFLVPAPGGRVRLAVFDVAGRRVRVLYDGPAVAGRHALGWDGRDDGGRHLASGVYFARLSLGDETRNRRLVIMR
jgi:flagellar hook assembly protein FlgD